LTTFPILTGYVPYTGATANVDLGAFDLTANLITGATGSFASSGGSDTFAINHSSGGGIALNITKGGNGEGLYINKTSGSGNAATIVGTLEATTLVKNGGTSSQFLKADGTVDSNTYALDSLVVHLAGTETITGIKNFNLGLTLQDGYYPTPATGYVGLGSNGSGITILTKSGITVYNNNLQFPNASNDYNFPNATGTLALTSDLSAYVTLAGTETITGAKTFSATSLTLAPTSGGGTLNLKQDAFLGATNGYTSLTSSGSDFAIIAATGVGTSKQAVFSLASLGATLRTYTFPDANGTIALTSDLNGYVPYSGATLSLDLGIYSYNGNNVIINGNNSTQNGTLLFKQVGALAFNSVGYSGVGILGTTSMHFNFNQSSGVYKQFNFSVSSLTNNTLRTLNIPDASGTIALTSDLSAYVTLAGTETITGAKTFSGLTSFTNTSGINLQYGAYINKGNTPLAFSSGNTNIYSDATTNNIVIRDNLSIAKLEFNNSTQTYTFPAATGTIALTSDLTGGTVTSVAALTIGTTGTDLSSTVANSTTTPVITLNVPTASAVNRGALSSADWTTFNNKQSALTNPVTGTGTTNYLPKFTGTSTIGNSIVQDDGSSVTIGGTLQSFNASPIYLFSTASTSNYEVLAIDKSATDARIRVYKSGTGSYRNLIFETGGSTKLTLDASGNLGLGVTPSAWGGSSKVFQVGARMSVYTDGFNNALFGNNMYFNGSDNYYINTAPAARFYIENTGTFIWNQAPSGTAGAAITFTQAMTLTAAGNVLIGTSTSNGARLEIKQANSLDYRALLVVDSATPNWIGLAHTGSAGVISVLYDGAGTATPLIFKTADTTRLTIASTGVASFSNSLTTSDLSATILSPNLGANQTVFLELGKNIADTYNSGEMSFKFVASGSSSNMVSLGFYGAGNKLNVLGNGNVGIGTSSPSGPLTVQANTGNTAIRLIGTSNASSNNAGIFWFDSNDSTFNGYLGNYSGSFDIYNHRSTPMVLYTGGTARLTIASTGAATFSSNQIGATGLIITNSSTDTTASAVARFNNSGSNVTYIGLGSTARASYVNIGANILSMYTDNAAGMSFLVDANGPMSFATNSTTRLTIASTGAATFSSSVTAGSSTSSGYATLNLIDSGTGSARYASIRKNYDSPFDLRIRASNSESAAPIVFDLSNAVEAMRITSGGNVGIGNSASSTIKFYLTSIGTTSSTYAMRLEDSSTNALLLVRDDGYGYLKASAWAYGSDKRIKENINYVEMV
jgi:fibronectin-binding autotransporter adhesin